ncbi:MAG TPA: transporter substrate-binding domain-containing protein, partial [Clostridia bacterium]|nr:transporter substrate-binding domain-containing protein [Clostridia bacterium]
MRSKRKGIAALILASLLSSGLLSGLCPAGGTGEARASERPPVEAARIGVMVGSTNEAFSEASYPKADIQKFNNYVDSTAALNAEKLDYCMMDYISALRFVRYDPNLEIVSGFLTDEKMCLAVGKTNPQLFEKVDAELDRLTADGTVADLLDRWIKPDGGDYEPKDVPVLEGAPV